MFTPRSRSYSLLLLVLLIGLGCSLEGCRKSNSPYVRSVFNEFYFEAEYRNATRVDAFEWTTTVDRAWVRFDGFDFSGLVRVQIFDDSDDLIYDEFFDGHGGHEEDRRLTDDSGADGEWLIVVTTTHVDGRVYLLLEPY